MSLQPPPPAPPPQCPVASNIEEWMNNYHVPIPEDQLDDLQCSICHNTLYEQGADGEQAERAVRITQCNHVFGEKCILAWTQGNTPNRNTCPSCRARFFEKEPEEDSSDSEEPQAESSEEDENEEDDRFAGNLVGTPIEHWQDWRDQTRPHREAFAQSIVQGDRDGIREAINAYLDRVLHVRVRQVTESEEMAEELNSLARGCCHYSNTPDFIRLTLASRNVRDA